MKKLLSLAAAVLLIGSTLAWGIQPIDVENASFELPGTKMYQNWDGELEGTEDVPGWSSDSTPIYSGIVAGWGATDGDWSAFLLSGDPSVWQVTEHIIAADETLRLQVDARDNMAGAHLLMVLFAYDEVLDPNDPNIVIPVRMPICAQEVELTSTMQTFTLECATADVPEFAGYKLGVEFLNSSAGNSLLSLDNVQLFTIVPTGVNIIWVTEDVDRVGDGIRDDHEWIHWLMDEGHTLDVRPDYWRTFDPIDPNDPNEVPKIDELNAADLIIVSRTSNSGNYIQAGEIETWNSIETPILLLNSYLARANRWNWINNNDITNSAMPVLEAVELDHPIFEGVTLEQLNIVDPNDLIDPNDPNAPIVLPDPIYGVAAFDPAVGSGQTSFIRTLDMGNGALLAAAYEAQVGAIAEWISGVEYYDGAGQVAADHRMLFCAGTQEVGATPQGAWNLTAEGETILRNAIAYLLYQPLPAREPVPASGTTGVPLNGTLSWRAGKEATMYEIHFSTSKSAVENGTALIDVVAGTSYGLAPLNLILGTTYYWRVDASDGEQVWPGTVQSFKATDYIVIDNFENYTNANIGNTWRNGWLAIGTDPVRQVSDIAHTGNQSMALPFDNTKNPFHINVACSPAIQNWTTAGARVLVIHFRGDPGNHPADRLWVMINGHRFNYNGDGMQKDEWTRWAINYGSLGTPLWRIERLNIGVGGPAAPAGYKGILYVDDLRLYRVAP